MINNLLLIDDDEISHFINTMVLKEGKVAREIITLKNGKEGMDYFKHLLMEDPIERALKMPGLILLDLNMPIMNGWEFLEAFSHELEIKFPETKVIILTSSVDPLDFSHSKIYHCVIGFISKPLTHEKLVELKSNEQLSVYFNEEEPPVNLPE